MSFHRESSKKTNEEEEGSRDRTQVRDLERQREKLIEVRERIERQIETHRGREK